MQEGRAFALRRARLRNDRIRQRPAIIASLRAQLRSKRNWLQVLEDQHLAFDMKVLSWMIKKSESDSEEFHREADEQMKAHTKTAAMFGERKKKLKLLLKSEEKKLERLLKAEREL